MTNMNKIIKPTFKPIKLSALLLTTLLLSANLTYAANKAPAGNRQADLNVSLGNLCEYIGTYQTDSDGSKNTCSFLPSLALSYEYYFTPKFALAPQFGATLPKKGADDTINRMTLFALANMKYRTNYVNLIGGLGFYFTRISGPGGEQELNNGSGTDSFPLPKEAVYSRNVIVNLGLGLDFTDTFSGELYTYIFNATESEDRAFSIGAALTYHFGDVL